MRIRHDCRDHVSQPSVREPWQSLGIRSGLFGHFEQTFFLTNLKHFISIIWIHHRMKGV